MTGKCAYSALPYVSKAARGGLRAKQVERCVKRRYPLDLATKSREAYFIRNDCFPQIMEGSMESDVKLDETKEFAHIMSCVQTAAEKVRKAKPLAPSITNTVTINLVANAQLAAGGAAAMVYLPDEGECVAEMAKALYINMGTLLPIYEETLPRTAAKMLSLGKPWVLDPVGIGIGSLRTKLLKEFKSTPPAIIRCNASEAIALANLWELDVKSEGESGKAGRPNGVESADDVASAVPYALALARFTHGAVAVSGAEDFVTDGQIGVRSKGGSALMEKITGAGCSLGGVCAVYACVTDPFIASVAATQHFNLAARLAGARVNAPASFQTLFIDELFLASPKDIATNEFSIVKAQDF